MDNKTKIQIRGIEFNVRYFHYPYEPSTREYPGADATIEIESIKHKDVEFYEFFNDELMKELEDEIWKLNETES